MEMRVQERLVNAIMIRGRIRKLSEPAVLALMESMKQIGLIQPITVSYVNGFAPLLVTGYHRLEAAKRLGWETIPCVILPDPDKDKATLAEIDENLIRNELSPAERAHHIQTRKEIYERLRPQTKRGATGRRGKREPGSGSLSFAENTAAATGRSKSSVKADSTRATRVPQIADVIGTSLDKGEELDALAQLPADQQSALITQAKEGQKVSARTSATSSENIRVRLPRPVLEALDAWIKAQPDPKPSRADAVAQMITDVVIPQRAPS